MTGLLAWSEEGLAREMLITNFPRRFCQDYDFLQKKEDTKIFVP